MIFYIKDYLAEGISDSTAIDNCLKEANESKERTIIFDSKDYFLDRAILLKSNTEVIIDNCTLKQNDLVFDNVFRGDNLTINGISPYTSPIDVTPISDIKIIGKGDAVISGPDKNRVGYHPYFEEYQEMTGDFWGYRTHTVSFSYGKRFELSGLKFRQTRGWCICFDNCQNCYLHDIDIRSNVKNGDGINFRSGCNHCEVENISGYTSDDTVACTALSTGKTPGVKPLSRYLATSEPYNSSHENIDGDVHHIKIKNILTGGLHHGVICLCARKNKVYDVNISNVVETDEGGREATVKIYTGYGDGYTKGDIHHIKVNNVVSNKAKYAVMIDCEPENIEIENVTQNNPDGQMYYKKSNN